MVMIIVGATSYRTIPVHAYEGGEGRPPKNGTEGTEEGGGIEGGGGGGGGRAGNATAYILVLSLGVLLEVAALGALWAYLRYTGYYIPCCPGKIARIRRRLHDQNTRSRIFNGQMGPISGGPISAQYCPPASPPSLGPGGGEGTPPPLPFTDRSETQRLMFIEEGGGGGGGGGDEGKVDGGDDLERILDEDPRIVLTPLKKGQEDI
ncbi:uncharacterized protein LOC122265137 [Penaeus japonicus]|uniref:uncharacterized protein LOC122265137 n=1 Tax=Penaeus japonicus TaxID=27405 RepID=UPI001C711D81|nr:uncharacterized protein LOC122265137 [Penaeus japonicus]XP_042890209.1 uncharacterized protein LOC122265137 [Penaeus japonicus]